MAITFIHHYTEGGWESLDFLTNGDLSRTGCGIEELQLGTKWGPSEYEFGPNQPNSDRIAPLIGLRIFKAGSANWQQPCGHRGCVGAPCTNKPKGARESIQQYYSHQAPNHWRQKHHKYWLHGGSKLLVITLAAILMVMLLLRIFHYCNCSFQSIKKRKNKDKIGNRPKINMIELKERICETKDASASLKSVNKEKNTEMSQDSKPIVTFIFYFYLLVYYCELWTN